MFDSWQSFASYLEGAQANFYYHLLLLLLLSITGLFLKSRAKPEKLDWRVNLALGSLIGLRLILLASFGFFWYSNISVPAAAAPIERTIHLVGILLFAWIWSRTAKENGVRQAIMALAIVGIFGVLLYITLPWLEVPAGTSFNYTNLDYIWSAACLVVISVGAIAIFRRGQVGMFGLIQMGVFFLGQIVHLLLAEPFGSMPLATEAANLLALPFLFALPVKEEKKEFAPGTEAFFPTEVPVYEIPEIIQDESGPPPHSPETEDLAKQTAKDFRADVSAFATLDDAQSEVLIHAGYNALLDTSIDLVKIQTSDLPGLTAALNSGQTLRISADQKLTDLDTLVRVLKLSFPGNLLASPVPNPRDDRTWFVALVRMHKPWQSKEEVNLKESAEYIGGKLITALGYLDEDLYIADEPSYLSDEGSYVPELTLPEPTFLETTLPEPTFPEPTLPEPTFPEPTLPEPIFPEPSSPEPFPDFLNELEKLETENERYKQDVARLLAHIDELKSQVPSNGGQALLHGAALGTGLQLGKEQLKSAISSLQASQGVAAPMSVGVEEAKAELRLALEEVASLQARLDSAQKAMLQANALQAPGRKIAANQVEVIASIAQELRQPLSSVMGYTDLLLGESVGILGALQRKFLERVRSSTIRMNTLIDDLIRIAELDQAGYAAERMPVDLAAVIDDVIGQMRNQLQQRHIALRVNLPNVLPDLNTDRDAVHQILYHLIQNADAATPAEGSITLRAVIDSQPQYGDFVLLQVTDSGGGIREDDLPRVFSRVYRTKNPTIHGVGDTGVGLAIAETLTQALGGRIWVESESGVGATFSVLLPLQPQEIEPQTIKP